MKIFISGPTEEATTSGMRRFEKLQKFFKDQGHEVMIELDVPVLDFGEDTERIMSSINHEDDLAQWLVYSLRKGWILGKCDSLFLLQGWKECHVCIILFLIAKKFGMPVYEDDGSIIGIANENSLKQWFENQIND